MINFLKQFWQFIVGSLIGLTGIIIAIVTHLQSKVISRLIYIIYPNTTFISKNAESDLITVFYDGKEVKEDIYAIQLEFKNTGKKPILMTDIIDECKRYRIKGSSDCNILDVKKISESRKKVKIEVKKTEEKNIIDITWLILACGDGARVQIIYTGKADENFVIEESIPDQNRPVKIDKGIMLTLKDPAIIDDVLMLLKGNSIFSLSTILIDLLTVRKKKNKDQ